MKEDFAEILAEIDRKRKDIEDNIWKRQPKDFLLILPETEDSRNFSAYEIYDLNTECIIGWEDEENQEKAVRCLLDNNVTVVAELP